MNRQLTFLMINDELAKTILKRGTIVDSTRYRAHIWVDKDIGYIGRCGEVREYSREATVWVSENTIQRSAKTDRQTEYYVCPGKPLSGWQKISDGLIKCACKQIYRGNMPVTELYAFNLICENLLAALFGVALNWNLISKFIFVTMKISLCRSEIWQRLVLL